MSITDVIEKHRKRLSMHRQFLAGEQQEEGGMGNDSAGALSPAAHARHHVSVNGDDGSGQRRQISALRSSSGSEPRSRRQYHHHVDASSHRLFAGIGGGGGGSEERYSEPEDFLIEAQLASLGKYYTKEQPDQMYKRGLGWLQSKQRRVEQTAEEIDKQRLAECTFVPKKISTGERSKTPTRSSKHSRDRGAGLTGPAPPISATAEIDERHFLERQAEARKLRAEAAKKARGADGSSWKPKTTVPVEFDFSKKMVQIPALRKPVLLRQQQPLYEGSPQRQDDVFNAARSLVQASEAEPPTSRGRPMSPTAQDASTSAASFAGSPTRTSASNNNNRRASRAAADEMLLIREELQRLSKSTEEKDREISALKGQMSSLQRELEVAKATVRKITLAAST